MFDVIIKLKTIPLFTVHIFQKVINCELKLEIRRNVVAFITYFKVVEKYKKRNVSMGSSYTTINLQSMPMPYCILYSHIVEDRPPNVSQLFIYNNNSTATNLE